MKNINGFHIIYQGGINMQITRGNYSQYANMVQQMFGNKKNPNNPLAQCDYGNFALRFKPVDIQFTKPNWDNIMTKRDKPAMSEEEFEKAIKELAQKEFATGKRDDAAYRKLCMQHGETVSPDRKAIYESSMRKTGGKMNAACMFWDNNGNKTLSYNPESRNWKAISTEEEFARARVFTSIYNDELARLKKEYGENAKGTRATLNARGAIIEINNIELYQGGNCMGVDSILGGNFSVQTKDFTKRTTSGATDVNQTQGLSESEKLENFKKEIWKEIDSMSWGSNISVQITNSAFEKMMVDKEFKNKMMNIIREDAHGSNMMCGGTLINIDENGYKGYSYMQDHTKEAGRAFDAHSKDKDSFYSKKCKKDELNELWERD